MHAVVDYLYMIASISGKVIEKFGRTIGVESKSGVGYGLVVGAALFGATKIDDLVQWPVYEHVREQEHTLFGFSDRSQQQFFVQLLSVNGVGPKAALAIFDLADITTLKSEISSANVNFLTKASGVGKKADEREVVDLRDKVNGVVGSELTLVGNDEAVEALLSLGYNKSLAEEMLAGITADTTEERVKKALMRR